MRTTFNFLVKSCWIMFTLKIMISISSFSVFNGTARAPALYSGQFWQILSRNYEKSLVCLFDLGFVLFGRLTHTYMEVVHAVILLDHVFQLFSSQCRNCMSPCTLLRPILTNIIQKLWSVSYKFDQNSTFLFDNNQIKHMYVQAESSF